MKYLYRCGSHLVEAGERCQIIECPDHSGLNTPVYAARDLPAELGTQMVVCDDPIRRAFNGAKIDHNLAEQQRPLDPLAPKDKFDARRLERETGRIYIGDSRDGLSKAATKALEKGDRREYAYQK